MMCCVSLFRRRALAALATFALPATLMALAARSQEKRSSPPPYPRINRAISYQVDPTWPQRPPDVAWGHVPGIAVDRQDRVWVFTRAEPPVQVYDASGRFLRAWGSGVIRTAHHLKFDREGNVWVADIGRHVVMKFTPEGKLLETLGTPDEPGADRTHLNQPTDMAIAPSGDVFVSDGYGNNRVVHFDRNGRFVREWGRLGTRPGEFSLPHAIALDSRGRLYVADRNNARVQVFDTNGRLLAVWENLVVPWGFWVTAKDEIWVCGSSPMPWRPEDTVLGCPPRDQVFMKFDPEGRLLQLWTVPKGQDGQEKPGECNWVHAIAVDSQGNLYVGDIIGRRAQKFVRVPAGTRVPAATPAP